MGEIRRGHMNMGIFSGHEIHTKIGVTIFKVDVKRPKSWPFEAQLCFSKFVRLHNEMSLKSVEMILNIHFYVPGGSWTISGKPQSYNFFVIFRAQKMTKVVSYVTPRNLPTEYLIL